MRVHPIEPQAKLLGRGCDARVQSLARIMDPSLLPLGLKRPVKIVDVTGVLPTQEALVEHHDSAAMDDEAYCLSEITIETLREEVEDLDQILAIESNMIVFWYVAGHVEGICNG
jgi:hypothetical protein